MSDSVVDQNPDKSGAPGPEMTSHLRYILLPTLFPALFLIFALTPVEVIGCRTRGLAVALIALAGGIIGIGTAITALVGKVRGLPDTHWWVVSSLILAISLVAVVILAG